MTRTLILTVFLIIVFFLAKYLGLAHLLHPKKWLILGFFVAFYFLFHRVIAFGLQEKQKNFIPFYLATVVLRLILCLIFIGVELYFGLQQQELFVSNFFVLYLFYTVFEIWNLSRNLRQN
jgi:lipoprotein signal peptidase